MTGIFAAIFVALLCFLTTGARIVALKEKWWQASVAELPIITGLIASGAFLAAGYPFIAFAGLIFSTWLGSPDIEG